MGDHEHPNDGGVHVHIHSAKFYYAIFGTLIGLTVLTVAVSYLDIDGFVAMGQEVRGVGAWNMAVAIIVATIKASLVVLFFMHLKDDARFNAVVFVGALLFVGIFLAYTMNDTAVRGTMDRYNGVHVDPDTGLRAEGGIEGRLPGRALAAGIREEAPAVAVDEEPAEEPDAAEEPAAHIPTADDSMEDLEAPAADDVDFDTDERAAEPADEDQAEEIEDVPPVARPRSAPQPEDTAAPAIPSPTPAPPRPEPVAPPAPAPDDDGAE